MPIAREIKKRDKWPNPFKTVNHFVSHINISTEKYPSHFKQNYYLQIMRVWTAIAELYCVALIDFMKKESQLCLRIDSRVELEFYILWNFYHRSWTNMNLFAWKIWTHQNYVADQREKNKKRVKTKFFFSKNCFNDNRIAYLASKKRLRRTMKIRHPIQFYRITNQSLFLWIWFQPLWLYENSQEQFYLEFIKDVDVWIFIPRNIKMYSSLMEIDELYIFQSTLASLIQVSLICSSSIRATLQH